MIHRVKSSVLIFLLAVCTAASAQTKTGGVRFSPHPTTSNAFNQRAMPVRPMPVRPVVVRLPAASARRGAISSASATKASVDGNFVTVAPGVAFGNATSFDLGQLLNNTPGLGFDFSHLAALNGNLGTRAFIDPVTQQDLALSERLLQISGSANTVFPFFGGGYSEPVVMEQQQPPVIVVQQPAAASEPRENTSAPAAAPVEEQPPLPDVGQFSLVLHSGKQIKAVAFTRQGDLIVYVTNDGIRGSFAVSDLDVPATQQMNQQHGTPLQLPL